MATPSYHRAPCFLVGAERSGTTLLRLMLDGHPEIAFASEIEFVVTRLDRPGWPATDEYADWLLTSRVFVDTGFTVDRRLSYCALMNSFLDQKLLRGGPGKHIVGGTVHYHFDRLLRIWPGARFIHLVRDPRDVARSCVAMGWAGNAWAGVDLWIEAERTWQSMKAALPEDRYIELSYESLVSDHLAELTRICAFLGLSYSPAMMNYTRATSYEMPNPGLIEQWKRKMPPMDIQLVEARVNGMLEAHGYRRSGLPPVTVSRTATWRLRGEDRLGRLRFGFRRYGFRNMLVGYFARHLGLKTLDRRMQIQRHAIERAYIK